MTFFELIRASLLADSTENRPPSKLVKAVLNILQTRAAQSCFCEARPTEQCTADEPNLDPATVEIVGK